MQPEEITALEQTVARFVMREITPAMEAIEAAGDFPHATIEAMGSAGLFGATPGFEALIAERGGEALGMALYYPVYRPSLAGRGLLMEDLYVRPEARRQGIGRALMARLARLAKDRGCVYIEWLVEGGNQAAERFYAAAGAEMNEGKMVCLIDGQGLDRLAKE